MSPPSPGSAIVSINPEVATKAIGTVANGLNKNPLPWIIVLQMVVGVAAIGSSVWWMGERVVPMHIEQLNRGMQGMTEHHTRQIDTLSKSIDKMADSQSRATESYDKSRADDRALLREMFEKIIQNKEQ